MKFLSAKQVSELWNITPRRVTLLAGHGRIEGAKQIDGRWFIPEGTPKPTDARKKCATPSPDKDGRYIFPFPLCVVNSEEQIQNFTPEEKELYRLGMLYEQGLFSEARTLAEQLLSSSNRYIYLGALYLLPFICLYLYDFEAVKEYFVLFHAACQDTEGHSAELDILLKEMDGEFISSSDFVRAVTAVDVDAYPRELLPLLGAYRLFGSIMALKTSYAEPDIPTYEILCRMTEEQGWFFTAMLMHLYLSLYFAFVRDAEREYRHMKQAFEIGREHGTLFTLSYIMSFNPETAAAVLNEYPPALRERVKRLSEIYMEARNAYADYLGEATALVQMKEDDYKLISCCLKEYSIGQMAACFGLSKSGINKRLAILYSKLGVKSKHEMVSVYLRSVLDWGKAYTFTPPKTH